VGRRPLIQRESAALAAVEIIDADGPDALSLERLATRLGVRAPSLYNHFSDKDEILTEAARQIVLSTPDHGPVVGDDWAGWLIDGALAFRSALLAHARAVPLVVEHFPRQLLEKLYVQHCRVLGRHGVPVDWQMVILESVHRMTIGSAMCTATGRPAMAPLTDPTEFDADLVTSMQAAHWSDEQLFADMMRLFLAGAQREFGASGPA